MLNAAIPQAATVQPIPTGHSLVSPTKRASEWLASKIEKARDKPFAEIITLTPDIAEVLLSRNPGNRPIRPQAIGLLCADISANNWQLNGESICIAKDGTMNNGQHRCMSVVETKKPVQTVIVFGLDRDSRFTNDMGSPRTGGDFLSMSDIPNASVAAAVARNLNCYHRGFNTWNSGGSEITKVMIQNEYLDNAKLIQEAIRATGYPVFKKFGWGICAAVYVILAKKNPAECSIFFARIQDGVGLRRGSAILNLRNRMLQFDSKKTPMRGAQRAAQRAALLVRYWNAWRKNAVVNGALQVPTGIPQVEA